MGTEAEGEVERLLEARREERLAMLEADMEAAKAKLRELVQMLKEVSVGHESATPERYTRTLELILTAIGRPELVTVAREACVD